MKILSVLSACLISITSATLSAYTKFCYTARGYPRTNTNYPSSSPELSFKKKKSYYSFSYHKGPRHGYVYLKQKERRSITEQLSFLPKTTVVNDSLIQQFLSASKRKVRLVGWVLQDFKGDKPLLTVGDVLTGLGIH